jgi:hypothetical protein
MFDVLFRPLMGLICTTLQVMLSPLNAWCEYRKVVSLIVYQPVILNKTHQTWAFHKLQL